jgi:hypothetical protein
MESAGSAGSPGNNSPRSFQSSDREELYLTDPTQPMAQLYLTDPTQAMAQLYLTDPTQPMAQLYLTDPTQAMAQLYLTDSTQAMAQLYLTDPTQAMAQRYLTDPTQAMAQFLFIFWKNGYLHVYLYIIQRTLNIILQYHVLNKINLMAA